MLGCQKGWLLETMLLIPIGEALEIEIFSSALQIARSMIYLEVVATIVVHRQAWSGLQDFQEGENQSNLEPSFITVLIEWTIPKAMSLGMLCLVARSVIMPKEIWRLRSSSSGPLK
jgi:hypothetical protein